MATSETSAAENPFYRALNGLLGENGFDESTEDLCQEFYAGDVGRPGVPLGVYFRMMMVGYRKGSRRSGHRVAVQGLVVAARLPGLAQFLGKRRQALDAAHLAVEPTQRPTEPPRMVAVVPLFR